MKLLPHQVKFAKDYTGSNLIVHEGGTGKTVCACVWLRDGRDDDALVICPKRVVQKWKDALKAWDTKALVLSKETFKSEMVPLVWSAIVVDEADEFASPLFLKGRSQLSEALYKTMQKNPTTPRLLLTATPIRSNPWNLHSLLTFSGTYVDWKKWRSEFFTLEYRPYLPRPAWMPIPEWRQKIRPILERNSDIVLLKDCVDDVPSVTETIIKMVPVRHQDEGNFFDKQRLEQADKDKEILRLGKEYRKVLVIAYYVEQVEELAKQLAKDRQVFMVHGGTKNQEEILKEANEVDECFLVLQASLGVGFDADTFSCVIFASMSYKVRDYIQMCYRVRRINNLHPVTYYYLIAGACDTAVLTTIKKGLDFIPSHWDNNNEST